MDSTQDTSACTPLSSGDAEWELEIARCLWISEEDVKDCPPEGAHLLFLDRLRDLCCTRLRWLSEEELCRVTAGHVRNIRHFSDPSAYDDAGLTAEIIEDHKEILAGLQRASQGAAQSPDMEVVRISRNLQVRAMHFPANTDASQPQRRVSTGGRKVCSGPLRALQAILHAGCWRMQELEGVLRHRDFNLAKHRRQLPYVDSLPTYSDFQRHALEDFAVMLRATGAASRLCGTSNSPR